MNRWNRSTSYANNLKIHTLGFPAEVMAKAWDILRCSEVTAALNGLLQDWAQEYDWMWQAGFNGRSGGYLVLYRGGLDKPNAKTARCNLCGKLTWHTVDTPCTTDGCIGLLQVLPEPQPQIITWPGKSVDQGEDFSEWDLEPLRERVRLVRSFDRLCDDVVDTFVAFCRDYKIVEAEVPAIRTIKTLQPLTQGDSL
ncbi:hypothetical protein [Pontiella sulfatireligans]|nr:hypothetical protein [Pontiella sulfatireligans]